MYACMYVCNIYIYMYIRICMHCARMYICICMYVCIDLCIDVCIDVCLYTHYIPLGDFLASTKYSVCEEMGVSLIVIASPTVICKGLGTDPS